ncbi:MFS transporter [Streptomyces sp. DSM 44915]|uniref:MFS transporter n=1 Tax=Streptomyces chisholmiae TaxID=3075540 RepID=A0ABU2JWX4_9ACTN|nr:MFS transporter [Streptomyces sp. DSM 44915]MDT0269502.1 MFS transporter [Streptomyces sp. DSM 44915]
MRSYRQLFRVPEFTPLFLLSVVHLAAQTVLGLALGVLIHRSTGSPLLTALGMFGSHFGQVLGANTLLSAADRLRPRPALAGVALLFALGALGLAAPGLPVGGALALVLALGLVSSLAGAVRWGLLLRVAPDDGYLLARSVLNIAGGATQIAGYALGGGLVALVAPRGALLIAAGLFLAAALTARLGLADHPPNAPGRPSVAETWRGNRRLFASPARRACFLALWVPNGLIVGCEALFVPYAQDTAWALFAVGALGMVLGEVAVGRLLPAATRARAVTPLRLLLAAPFALFALRLPLPVAVLVVGVACVGFGAGLLLQERLLALTPAQLRGQALGLHSAGTLGCQALGATLAGAVASVLSPGGTMALLALLSVLVTAALTPAVRRPLPEPTEPTETPIEPTKPTETPIESTKPTETPIESTKPTKPTKPTETPIDGPAPDHADNRPVAPGG